MTFPFFFQPVPIPVSGWPGPGSTRRAGPYFKTIQKQLGIGLEVNRDYESAA